VKHLFPRQEEPALAESSPPTALAIAFRWAVWLVALGVWTALLLSSQAPAVVDAVVPDPWQFTLSKAGHVSAYAFLSVLTGFLPGRPAVRVALWLFLLGHACLTEHLQLFVPGRHGSLRDVGLDAVGIALGWVVLAAWRRLRRA
jgi:VanZ family protein